MFEIIVSIILGLFSGFLSGFTGISSAGIILAGLSLTKVIKYYKTLIGTMLYVVVFPITAGSVWQFYKTKKINYFIGNILLVSFLLGSYLGTKTILNADLKISEKTIKYITSVIAFTLGTYFFYSASIL